MFISPQCCGGRVIRRCIQAVFGVLFTVTSLMASSGVAHAAWACPPEDHCPRRQPPRKTLSYEFQTQGQWYWCGPAATRIALTARGKSYSQPDLVKWLDTERYQQTEHRSQVTDLLNKLLKTGWYQTKSIPGNDATQSQIDLLKQDILFDISQGFAIVANVLGTGIDLQNHAHSYSEGHYLTVVGYTDNGNVAVIADPAIRDSRNGHEHEYPMSTAKLATWIAGKGYVA